MSDLDERRSWTMAETRAAEAMRELELEAESWDRKAAEAWDKVAAEAREQMQVKWVEADAEAARARVAKIAWEQAKAKAEAAEARAMAARARLAADAKVCNRARCTFRVPPPYA